MGEGVFGRPEYLPTYSNLAINGYDHLGDKRLLWTLVFRKDQKGIMKYKSGSMGIQAVPGAGKTFIVPT